MRKMSLIDRMMLDKLIDQCVQIDDIGFCNGKMGIAVFYSLSRCLDDPFFFEIGRSIVR